MRRTLGALIETQEVQRLIRTEINTFQADFADFERVRMFKLLDREFTQENDEMTPTLKLKRRVILEHFKEQIEQMYGDEEESQ